MVSTRQSKNPVSILWHFGLVFFGLTFVVGVADSFAQTTVSYDIVYVKAPRFGDNQNTRVPEVFDPIRAEPGTDLVLLHPDGTEEVLVAGGNGVVMDPYVSFDGKWVFYAKIHDQTNLNSQRRNAARSGSDIFKINLETREVIQLTNQEWTPNTGVANWSSSPNTANSGENYLGYGIYNLAPCPLPGGKIMFSSSRNGFLPNKSFTFPNLQLYVMDDDGKNVELIGHMNLGSALHPTILKDGRVMFSSYEAQGNRSRRLWGIWSIWPDGRHWEPLMSAFNSPGGAFHWQTQLSDGSLVVTEYYNLNNNGFGSFFKFPATVPPGEIAFGDPVPSNNASVQLGYFSNGKPQNANYSFPPFGMEAITEFANVGDSASPYIFGDESLGRAGKVTQPSGAPDNDLLLVYSPGPANSLNRPTNKPYYDMGLYVQAGGQAVNDPRDLVLIKNDPNFNEQQPRAVVSYRDIYGVDEPVELPWLPNDGTLSPELPAGTPFGLIGTSSFYKRDTKPGKGQTAFDGLDPFNTYQNGASSNWGIQGSDAGVYSNSDIHAVRILTLEPTSHLSYGPNNIGGGRNFKNTADERMRILGEIPLRKFDAQGNPILDPEGNPDTSFLAKIPADTPFTFQTIDKNGMVLNMSQTWHQVRPGEVLTSCGGCHAHSQEPLDFSQTAAAKPEYVISDLANTTPFIFSDGNGNSFEFSIPISVIDLEYYRYVKPILERSCVQCHSVNGPAEGGLVLDDVTEVNGVDNTYNRLANDYQGVYGIPPLTQPMGWNQGNQSRYIRSFQSRRSLLMWKLYGQRLDGWTNADHPSATIPGDPSTLPNGGVTNEEIEQADIDYQGTIMPPPGSGVPPLTETEKMIIARWIDLGSPVTMADPYFAQSGFFADELRPTLFLSTPRARQNTGTMNRIRFSAFDYFSQLDSNFTISLNFVIPGLGRPAGANLADLFIEVDDHIWEYQLPSPISDVPDGEITVEVQDLYGNKTRIKRNFSFGGGGSGAGLDGVHGWRDLNQNP